MTTYTPAPFHVIHTATQPQSQQPAKAPRLIDGQVVALGAGIVGAMLVSAVSLVGLAFAF